ncbi:MAG: hypothetical protein GOV15_03045, partial [Candidatus Diapherotrites archaeon]|nr:hypothetical protein [Candidatus Diapherotrites archaeon]
IYASPAPAAQPVRPDPTAAPLPEPTAPLPELLAVPKPTPSAVPAPAPASEPTTPAGGLVASKPQVLPEPPSPDAPLPSDVASEIAPKLPGQGKESMGFLDGIKNWFKKKEYQK